MFGQKNKHSIYLDHAATTPVHPAVVSAMQPYWADQFANPSGLYTPAVRARAAVDAARSTVASFLETQPDTVYFVSGGTESCNTAIFGLESALREKSPEWHGGHIIASAIEHDAVRAPIQELEKRGCAVTYLAPDESGVIRAEDVRGALREDTFFVSVMYANNEIGSIQPVAEIGREILKWRKKTGKEFPYFHTDAAQASAFLPMQVDALHVDYLSFNGSKIYGPKGAGVLYRRRGVPGKPLIYGGGQEFGMKSGTEDVPSIVGMGEAVSRIPEIKNKEETIRALRNELWQCIEKEIPDVVLNGPPLDSDARLANNLNVSFLGCDAEALILYLDAQGICVSSGSACATGEGERSHVLVACGYDEARIAGSIRMTLGVHTTKKDSMRVCAVLPNIVERVRGMNHLSHV